MTVITQLPDPPSRTTPSQFSSRTDAFLGALPGFVTETNAVASEVNADKTTAVNSAVIAVTKAAEATASASTAAIVGTSTKWISGTTYTEGQGVWSPIDLLPYRRLTDGAGTLDPSMDSVNWNPLPPVPMVRAARTANVEITPADRGHFFDITSGTFSQTFSSKAILGNGFYCYILNSGTGVVTIDPGGLDYALYQKHSLLIECDGVSLRVVIDSGPRQMRLPIFSPEAATKTAISILEDITLPLYTTGLTNNTRIVYGGGLFIASDSITALSNIATSPDGINWILRTMPTSGGWMTGTNGTNKFIAHIPGSTTIAKSTSGTSWSAGTSLPVASHDTYAYPVFNGDICLICKNDLATAYSSSDNGTSWTPQTLPTNAEWSIRAIGGLFWIWTSSTTAYTSATGATGSWVSRTLPITPGNGAYITKDTDGALMIFPNGGGNVYKTTDGINWSNTGITAQPGGIVTLNGVATVFSPTFPNCKTLHNGIFVTRLSSTGGYTLHDTLPVNGSGVFCFPTNTSKVALFDPPANSATPTAIFEG